MSADNYRGTVVSYVYLTKVQEYPGTALEWVREDSVAIQNNGGRFPSPPGVYYIELTQDKEFYVDPLLDITNEVVTKVTDEEWQLQNPFVEGTLRLYEMPSAFRLREGANYTVDNTTGSLTLMEPVKEGRHLLADYRYPAPSTGPHVIRENHGNKNVIPGCLLAFGRRNQKGDRMAVVVQDIRRPAALEYGGRWEISLDIDVITRDVYSQQEILDRSILYLWGIARSWMSTVGIEMKDVAMGGESEEVYDETGDDYYYNASFSVTVETEWGIHVPLIATIKQVSPMNEAEAQVTAGLTEEELRGVTGNIQMLDSLGLESVSDPYFSDKNANYEKIR